MLDKLKEIIKRILPDTNTDNLSESTKFAEDLSFDSLNMMMFCVELEELFDFKFAHPVIFETLGDVCGYLECKI